MRSRRREQGQHARYQGEQVQVSPALLQLGGNLVLVPPNVVHGRLDLDVDAILGRGRPGQGPPRRQRRQDLFDALHAHRHVPGGARGRRQRRQRLTVRLQSLLAQLLRNLRPRDECPVEFERRLVILVEAVYPGQVPGHLAAIILDGIQHGDARNDGEKGKGNDEKRPRPGCERHREAAEAGDLRRLARVGARVGA
jgi:hypothetical protein